MRQSRTQTAIRRRAISPLDALDETVARIQHLRGSIVRPKTAVPRTAWVTIVTDPAKNIFDIWQADPTAFPLPEPD